MSDQLSDAQNSGFDPYAHARQKREAEQGREVAQAARETELIDQLTDQVAKQIHRACPNACAYEAAGAALSVLVPLIAERDAALARLRDHLLAEADRLDNEPWSPYRASESIAGTLRKIVEETR